ncbi:MAG: LysM peptidoglycan-binding domain-containing protein [Oscillospiraceae bacterium]|nr:LysM peptidoglycan-binding domain-containing protein [Oscillospiraceae bacterium]
MTIHIVQPGQTLYGIAAQYGVDPELLRLCNGVPPDAALAVGQTLVIETVQTLHVVQPGQTLSAVARQYGLSLRQLYRNNYWFHGMPDIRPNQTLVIAYEQEKLGSTHTNGYAYPFIRRRELSASLPYMTCVTPFTYGINAQGGLLPLADGVILEEASRLGAAALMHLSTLTEEDTFSSQRAETLLSDVKRQEAILRQVQAMIEAKGYRGVDVDFEYIPGTQKDNYAAFIRRLRAAVSPLPVLVALAPKTWDGQPGLLYEGHDYKQLGAAADFVLLMTYEWGYTYGPPMAVAPLPDVRQVVDYAVTVIPREKIWLGIPNYGYDWPLPFRQGTTRARSISNQYAVELAVKHRAEILFDEQVQSPWFRYTEDGVVHEVWFEDARSMRAKLALIQEYGLYGAGYWNLMRPYPQGWTLLNAMYDVADVWRF